MRQGMKIISPITRGSRTSQHAVISWSNLILGRLALNHTNTKQKKQILSARIILCRLMKVYCSKITGKWNPPKKKIAVKALMRIILEYSARKKNTKTIAE